MSIKQRANQKDQALAELYARRKKEHDIKKCEQEFELKLRLDKVRREGWERGGAKQDALKKVLGRSKLCFPCIHIITVSLMCTWWPQVDAIQKSKCFQRDEALGQIMRDFEKTRSMLREREELQRKRKQANMDASLNRAAMQAVREREGGGRG